MNDPHKTHHVEDESFQAINCTGTETETTDKTQKTTKLMKQNS